MILLFCDRALYLLLVLVVLYALDLETAPNPNSYNQSPIQILLTTFALGAADDRPRVTCKAQENRKGVRLTEMVYVVDTCMRTPLWTDTQPISDERF